MPKDRSGMAQFHSHFLLQRTGVSADPVWLIISQATINLLFTDAALFASHTHIMALGFVGMPKYGHASVRSATPKYGVCRYLGVALHIWSLLTA